MRLLDLLYAIAFLAGLPLWLRRLLGRDSRRHLLRRFSPGAVPGARGCIWIHAVSVGEVRGIARLLRRTAKAFPQPLVLTVTTLSGFRWARRAFPELTVIPAPLDFSFTVRAYLRRLEPRLLVLNELEIWPNWIRRARRRGVPVVVANARLSDPAFRRYRRFRRLLAPTFRRPQAWLVQSALYVERFTALGVPVERIRVCGNIKADQALEAAREMPPPGEVFAHLHARAPRRPLAVMASTHAEDEAVLLPALAALEERPAVILVPRHPDRTAAICRRLERLGLPFAVWSQAAAVDLDRGVLVYDRIGYLLPLMSVADRVFMGGTFSARTGGHNLYEPAALGRAVSGGPHTGNFPDMGGALRAAGAYREIPDAAAAVDALAGRDGMDDRAGQRARAQVEAQRGATDCILDEMKRWLNS